MRTLRQGFTLVEIMVGMVLTVGSAAALFALLTQTFGMARPMREYTRSSFVALSEIEKIRALGQSAIEAMPATNVITTTQNPEISRLPGGEVTVYREPYATFHPGTAVYSVSVEVSWQERNGGRTTNVLSSIVYSQGVGK